ncbi:hypothetical protein QUF61_16725 [Candidatus Venteria ishoeyi]|nr:hypothetical protein [Candidatus Venteria ishoeyi]MDM8548135.1 hypothetical protein [Candidatus Venteria ishoeyi]
MYHLQANCFISKPLDLDDFIEVMNMIEKSWFIIACLPQEHQA